MFVYVAGERAISISDYCLSPSIVNLTVYVIYSEYDRVKITNQLIKHKTHHFQINERFFLRIKTFRFLFFFLC